MSAPISAQQLPDWRDLIASKLAEQRKELEPFFIPFERLPPIDQKKVLDFFDRSENRDLLTELEREITEEPDVAVVLEKTRSGKWKCEELTRAYIKRYVQRNSVRQDFPGSCVTLESFIH